MGDTMRYKITVLGKERTPVYTLTLHAADDAEALAAFTTATNGVPWRITDVGAIRELVVEVAG